MKKHGIFWVDTIKVVAIFSVVWLHSAAPLLYKYNELLITDWWAGNIYDSMVRMCVPLFFMLSGYLLLEKNEAITTFFTKRISKVVFPLIIWSVFYIFWKRYYLGGEPISFYDVYSLLLTPAYYHLWFLYAIIGLYLLVPILRVFVQNSRKKLLYYFVALWFVAVSATHIDNNVDLQMILSFAGYLLVGYALGNIKNTRKHFIISFVVVILTISITSLGTYILTVRNGGGFLGYFYSYLSPNIIFMSASFFVFIKYIAEKAGAIDVGLHKKLVRSLSSACLGIYLIHPMILDALKEGSFGFYLSSLSFSAIYSVPATAIVTFSISFLIIYLIQKIPVVRRIVP